LSVAVCGQNVNKIPQSKIAVLRIELFLTINGGFYCDIVHFYGTALELFNGVNF